MTLYLDMSLLVSVLTAEALARFSVLCAANLTILPVAREQFHLAARFANQYGLAFARAADALHLAIGADCGATLCTLDRRLSDAGPALGVPAVAV